jgi:hypothetical protein
LDLRVLVNSILLSEIDNSGKELIDIRWSVHISPQRLSVLWVITTSIGLFTSVVYNRNTNSS